MSIFAVIFHLAENASGGDVFDLIGDVDPTDEDGEIGMGDSTGVSASLDGEIFSGGKKCQESYIGDSDNTVLKHPGYLKLKVLFFQIMILDSTDESLVYSTPLPPLKKLDGIEPISGPKTIKSTLRSKSTFKAKTFKGVTINEPSSARAKGNKSSSASKVNSAPAGKLKSVKIEDDPPLAIIMKELNSLKLQISKNQSSYFRNNQPQQFDEKKGTIFNSNKEVVMIALRISEHSCSLRVEDTLVQNTISIPNPSLPTPSTVTPAPQDRWSQNKHTELVNIIGNPGARMLTRAMAKELGATLAHECIFVDFLSEEEPKKVPKRKSTAGAGQLLGGKHVCWSAKKQQSVAMSLAKTEYVAATRCCANILWLKSQLTNYDIIYKKSSSAKDKSPIHPSPPTPVVGKMHKEAQQAAGSPTSLGATSEERAHPQISSGTNLIVLVDQTKSAGNGLKTTYIDSCKNEESRADDISKKIKLEDLSNLLKDTRSAFFTPDSPQYEPFLVSD
nr:retrovirus-related Pol polyprotein from transposon TNT 1-94 [Tanacetum cinerariifolium]